MAKPKSGTVKDKQDWGIATAKLKTRISHDQEVLLLEYLKTCMRSFPFSEQRARLERIDKAYNQEPCELSSKEQGKYKDEYDYIIPLVKPDVDAIGDYLINTFLSANQLFTVVASPDNEDGRKQMQAVINESSEVFKYQEELSIFIRESVRYNLAAIDVSWETVVSKTVEATGTIGTDATIKNITFQGNKIKRVNPYNLFFDTNVELSKITQDGDFVGYIERLSIVQLYKMFSALKDSGIYVNHETKELWSSAPSQSDYYTPDINSHKQIPKGRGVWAEFFDANMTFAKDETNYTSHFDVTTIYARIIPKLFGLNVPAPDVVQIWKFIVVNNQYIVYAERETNAHDLLNVVVAVPQVEGLDGQSKSVAEILIPYQQLSSELWQIRRASLYRAVDDRGVYDPTLIAKSDIESKNPRAKIPLKKSANRDTKPSDAYYAIPFREEGTRSLDQEIANIRMFANELAGTNNTVRGQFQKGNKTRYEYQDVQQNAISGQVVMALMLEVQVFSYVKRIIKMNILLNQESTQLYDAKTKEQVNVDPVALRQASIGFKIADGVANTKSLINVDALREAMMFISQSPEFQMEYDVGKLLAFIFGLENADLSDFKRDATGQQQFLTNKQGIANAGNPKPPAVAG